MQKWEMKKTWRQQNMWRRQQKIWGGDSKIWEGDSKICVWRWKLQRQKKRKNAKKNFQSLILIGENEKVCPVTFFDLVSGCQCSRSRVSTYSEQDVKVSKRMSLYQYSKKTLSFSILTKHTIKNRKFRLHRWCYIITPKPSIRPGI